MFLFFFKESLDEGDEEDEGGPLDEMGSLVTLVTENS